MRVDMVPGQSYDLVSNEEMHGHIAAINSRMQQLIAAEYAGIKPIRMTSGVITPPISTQTVITINSTVRSGYVWAIMRAVLAGSRSIGSAALFRSQDPSQIVMITGSPSPDSVKYVVDQFDSNSIYNDALHFGKGQLLLNAGEFLSVGFASPATQNSYALMAEAIEVPAEMVGKLLI